ncbi:hypothetical protein GCM10010420_52100 [Streptomyces glaucosporus]|uniref:Uncharacterized protein n=1 Tax=Streptomyces glaucosporus TaxID=284044 RepID=A0ABP5W2W4_9ACTN
MQRQVAAAIKTARAVQRTMEDGVGELKSAQRRLKDAVTRFQRAVMVVVVDGGQAVVERAQCIVDQPDPRKGEDVTEAQRELDEILRDAFLADQELAITLTANIGLDMWFNAGKLRSGTDSTGSIGVDLYDALDRAARGEDPHPEKNHQSPRDVLVNWVTGTGESEKVFTERFSSCGSRVRRASGGRGP